MACLWASQDGLHGTILSLPWADQGTPSTTCESLVVSPSYCFVCGQSASLSLWAADRVFRLADDNYVISPSPDGLRAERNWKKKEALLTSDFSRATSFGSDTWMVTPKPLPQGGVKVTAMHSMQAAFVSGCLLLPYPNRSDATLCPEMPNLTTTSATYDLFFARLDYLLGKRKDWITCKKAQKLFTNGESSV